MPYKKSDPSSRVEAAAAQQSTNPFVFYPVCCDIYESDSSMAQLDKLPV